MDGGASGEHEPGADRDDAAKKIDELEVLREILVGHYQQRAAELESELHNVQVELGKLERTVNDKQALIDTMTPVVASSIQKSIAESKESMIEALYPIVGRLVTRAVSEAMRELTRRIDEQMRNALTLRVVTRRMRARALGISEAELALREALPFQVHELFLIHRESGILLRHASSTDEETPDSDVVSGMLTAVSDFVDDAFGHGREGDLDQIQYGDTLILLEEARYTYLAVVTQGFAPPGFQADIRQQLYRIEERFGSALREFDGDVAHFAATDPLLHMLFRRAVARADEELAIPPDRFPVSAAALAMTALIIVALALFGWRLWHILGDAGLLSFG